MSHASAAVHGLWITLAATVGLLLINDAQPRQDRRAQEFQHLVGGLGFGPAIDLGSCEFSFDPRLCSGCSHDVGPVPGGMIFCPYHAAAMFDYPSLTSNGADRKPESSPRK